MIPGRGGHNETEADRRLVNQLSRVNERGLRGEGDRRTEGGQRGRAQRGSQSRGAWEEEEEDGFELQGWNSGIRTLLYSRLPF